MGVEVVTEVLLSILAMMEPSTIVSVGREVSIEARLSVVTSVDHHGISHNRYILDREWKQRRHISDKSEVLEHVE